LERKIVGYHKDEEGHWVADLDCGHTHHLRHIPPFFNRAWVLDPEERERRLGWTLNCVDCDEPAETHGN